MRIGIFETDTLQADIEQKYGGYVQMFQRLFLSIDNTLTFNVYPVIAGKYPDNMDACDAYLITGSQHSAYDNAPWIKKLRLYIVSLHQHNKKLIGICFGHQIIAHALGGLTKKSEKGWRVGNISCRIEKHKPWMGKAKKQFSMLVSHQDQVLRLPECAELIASSEYCINFSFQLADHILTFQGHPEFSADYLKYLMYKRRDKIGVEKYDRAIESLQQDQDAKLVAQWIVDFMVEGHLRR